MEQTSMSSFNELIIFQLIKHTLSDKLIENDIPSKYLKFEERKNYTSVLFNTSVIVRFTETPSLSISVPTSLMPENNAYSCLNTAPAKDYIKIKLDPTVGDSHRILLKELLADVMQNFIDKLPKEFDCCSRYMECSNAKHCVHPDQDFSLKCGYRKTLRSGKIFFGPNRNID